MPGDRPRRGGGGGAGPAGQHVAGTRKCLRCNGLRTARFDGWLHWQGAPELAQQMVSIVADDLADWIDDEWGTIFSNEHFHDKTKVVDDSQGHGAKAVGRSQKVRATIRHVHGLLVTSRRRQLGRLHARRAANAGSCHC